MRLTILRLTVLRLTISRLTVSRLTVLRHTVSRLTILRLIFLRLTALRLTILRLCRKISVVNSSGGGWGAWTPYSALKPPEGSRKSPGNVSNALVLKIVENPWLFCTLGSKCSES